MEYTVPDASENPANGQHQEDENKSVKGEDMKDQPGRQWIIIGLKQVTGDQAYYDSSLFT